MVCGHNTGHRSAILRMIFCDFGCKFIPLTPSSLTARIPNALQGDGLRWSGCGCNATQNKREVQGSTCAVSPQGVSRDGRLD